MKLSHFVALVTAFTPTLAQYGHKHNPNDLPYRPFPPYQSWPERQPAPQITYSTQSAVTPKVKSAQIIGLADDPALNRDSCGSVPFGDRVFWTCRDTQLFYSNGSVQIAPLITSTASWTDYGTDGGPALTTLPSGGDPLRTIVLKQYGKNTLKKAFFPVTNQFCGDPAGGCSDGTRYALWPDLPPMVTQSTRTSITAYTWIRQSHIRQDLSEVETNPATTLYKVTYNPSSYTSKTALPKVSIISQNFWSQGQIAFGNYGNVVRNGIAYLYGQAEGATALAKVPVGKVEDKSSYQYWVNGAWTKTMPTLGQDGINITNANAQGQGTYYYSKVWKSYVWIGGGSGVGSAMYITTAPAPEGPWITPFKFFQGVDGNYFLGAYSIQAHPGLISDKGRSEIYVTYTKNDLDEEGVNVYSSPLVHVVWE